MISVFDPGALWAVDVSGRDSVIFIWILFLTAAVEVYVCLV
jgi:hypothetical protein